MNEIISIKDVEAKVLTIRQQAVLLAQDVAELYGVETREVSQAIKNNPLKFPDGYVFELTGEEVGSLKSKFLTPLPCSRSPTKSRERKATNVKGDACELRRKMPVTMSEFAKAGLIAAVETYRHLVAHQLPGRSGRGDEDCDWYLDGYLKASHKRRVAISANAFDVLCARDFFKIRGFLFG